MTDTPQRYRAIVRNIIAERGFLFVKPLSGQTIPSVHHNAEVFCHRASTQQDTFDALRPGDLVSFEVRPDHRNGKPCGFLLKLEAKGQ